MMINHKSQITNCKFSRGFTLLEMLASIVILVAVGSIMAGIITSSLRGANKTNTIENIRQNGNYALNQIVKDIEFAQVFNGFSNDGVNYQMNCPESFAPTPTPVVAYEFIKITSLDGNSMIYNCDGSILTVTTLGDGITPTPIPLVDVESVSLESCSFTCIQSKATDTPIIKIKFSIESENPSGLMEKSSPLVTFETSVSVRNYNQ